MSTNRGAAGSPLTWGLALLFLVPIDVAITRTPLLWGPTSYENTHDLRLVQLAETYKTARKLYAPERPARVRVALLGDSRLWFAAHEPYVERQLRRRAPELDVRVDTLAVFGALIGDMEVISRHLDRQAPSVVVLAIGGQELVPTADGELQHWPARLLSVGWRDGPLPPASQAERLDRWLRTVWPLYRFHEFARAALADRIFPGTPAGRPLPDHFSSSREVFDYFRTAQAPEVEAAYRAWREHPSLPAFLDYVLVGHPLLPWRPRVAGDARPDARALEVLDALLGRLRRQRTATFVLLLPENPLLDLDTAGEYHSPGFSDRVADAVRAVAARQGIRVVDGRRWMPAEAFYDLLHLMPDLSGFQEPLAEEILRALRG